MKNFFKKLAFVLAAALVITTIAPGATAKAAAKKNPGLAYAGKILYLGGDYTGKYEDTYTFKFKDTWGLKATWKALNPNIAKMSDEKNTVVAVAPGTAKFDVTLKDAKGNVVKTQTATVWVKQNADEVGFGSQKAIETPKAVNDTFRIYAYRALDGKKVWATKDYSVITDKIVWSSSDEKVATVTADYGTVKCVGAGEATITATVVQSNGVKTDLAASYKVTVNSGLVGVKQTGLNTAEVTFGGDLSKEVTKDNLVIKSMLGDVAVNFVVKSVEFDKEDKSKAVVTTYSNFAKDTEYVVSYKESKTSFVGVDTSKDAIASIAITSSTIAKGSAKDVKVKLFDKNGVDITTDEYLNYVTLEAIDKTSSDFYLDTANKKITFYEIGKTAEIKAIYHTYKYDDNYKEITLETAKTLVSVTNENAIKTVDVFTLYKTTVDFEKPVTRLSISDNYTYRIAVKTTDKDGKKLSSIDNLGENKFTFESTDKNVLLVSESNIYPVKEGTASIIVKYNKVVIGAYTVNVVGKRVPTEVTIDLSKTQLSASTLANDSIVATVNVKDQLGDKMPAKYGEIELTLNSCPKDGALSYTRNQNKFTFIGEDGLVAGTYGFKVVVDKQVRYFSFTVSDNHLNVSDITNYRLSNSGKNVDMVLNIAGKVEDTVNNNTNNKSFNMNFAAYNSNGNKVQEYPDLTIVGSVSKYLPIGHYAVVKNPDNKTPEAKFVSTSGSSIVVNPIAVSGSALTKAKKGNYQVTVFEVLVNDDGDKEVKSLTSGNFVLTDSQPVIVPTINKNTSTMGTVVEAVSEKDGFLTIKIGEVDVYNRVSLPYNTNYVVGSNNNYTVKKVVVDTYVLYNNEPCTYKMDVNVGANVTVGQ